MNYKETLEKSIKRIDILVNESLHIDKNGIPLPSWIELSPVDVCNRFCIFCPKNDDTIAPNQSHKMSPILYKKIAKELQEISFTGTIMLAGYGEPLINKDILNICREFSKFCNVEITTNGDLLSIKYIKNLYNAGTKRIIVSMYDGAHQIEEFNQRFTAAGISKDNYTLRDRWYKKEDNFGIRLTNRAGTLKNTSQIDNNKKCYYPHYSMMVDWNGDVFLCTQDWNRKIKTGNLMFTSVYKIWTSPILKKYRLHLINSKRDLPPCNRCDADGTLHGEKYSRIWEKYYAQ